MWLLLLGLGAIGAGYAVASHRRHHAPRPNPNPPAGMMADGTPCTCSCHQTGAIHIAPCCDAWGGQGDPLAARHPQVLPSFSPNRGHYGYYDDRGNYHRG